jgi:hypothetical protein
MQLAMDTREKGVVLVSSTYLLFHQWASFQSDQPRRSIRIFTGRLGKLQNFCNTSSHTHPANYECDRAPTTVESHDRCKFHDTYAFLQQGAKPDKAS